MLRLSKLTDYGIVVMAHLAGQPSRARTAAEIAAALPIGAPTVSKLLKLLARGGLLVSQRGAKGGYVLAREPEEISVAQVIDALEGPIALTECNLPGVCRQAQLCNLRDSWKTLSDTVYRALDGISLAQMAQTEKEAIT